MTFQALPKALFMMTLVLSFSGCDGTNSEASPSTSHAPAKTAPPAVTPIPIVVTPTKEPVTLTGDTNRPSNSTFETGESVDVLFTASGLRALQTVSLVLRVSDEFGNEISNATLPMAANESGASSIKFSAPSSKLGYYRIDASLPGGSTVAGLGTRPAGFVTYAVVPNVSKRTNYGDDESRFGMQGGFSSSESDVLGYLGVRYLLGGPGWSSLEPKYAGQFASARSAALAKGQTYPSPSAHNSAPWPTFSVPLVTTASVPAWALEAGTQGSICKTMGALNSAGIEGLQGFTQTLAEVAAEAYPGQSAHYYEITWEPASWCFGGSTKQLVQYFQLSYAPIHKKDPKAVVMGPTLFPGDASALKELWAAGLGNYIDAVSMHPYAKFPPEEDGLVTNIRTQMQMAKDAKGHSIPFVGTEHGYTSSSIGELNEALGNIRTTLILLGEGFKFDFAFYVADFWDYSPAETGHTYGYYWNLNPKIDYGTDKMGPKPSAPAFAAMTFLLDGTTTSGPLTGLTGTQMGYRFQRNGKTMFALWDYQAATSESTVAIPDDQNIQVCDWMANCKAAIAAAGRLQVTLGQAPTYVIAE